MFTGIDAFSYIPLLVSVAIIIYVCFRVLRFSSHNSRSATILRLTAAFVFCIGLLFSSYFNSTFVLACVLLLSTLFIAIAYSIPQKESKVEDVIPEETFEEFVSDAEPITENTVEQVLPSINYDELLNVTRSFILEAANTFSNTDNGLDTLLELINNSIMTETKADGAALLLVDDFEDIISVKAFNGDFPPPYEIPADIPHKIIRVSTNFRFAQFSLSNNIFGEVATSGKAELITDSQNDSRIFKNTPEDFLRNGSYIFVPMVIKDVVIGVISIARKYGNPVFTEEEFNKAKILTDFASAAIRNVFAFQEVIEHSELIRESEIACKCQSTLSPKLMPSIPSLSLGCYNNNAEGVCGDYYDIIPARKDRISFILADVAGKGMNSLLVMIMIRAIMRLVVNTNQSAATILEWANRGISTDIGIDHFASLSLINYNIETKKVQFSSAGTTPVYYYSNSNNTLEKITSPSEPIGVEKITKYVDKDIDAHSGDIILTFTDGLVETLDEKGEQYSKNKLLNIVLENHQKSGREIAELVKSDVKKFCGSARLHDDQTLLVIKIQ